MIPSKHWFPGPLQERAAWFDNFATQFAVLGVPLGFVAADVTAVNDDNQVVQFLGEVAVELGAYSEAVRQYRVIITEGDIGDPTPLFPEVPTYDLPVVRPTGIFERLVKLVDRIRAAPTYTDEAGALLGIIPEGGGVIAEGDVQPEIELFAAATGYTFSIVVSKRYDADQWQVWGTPVGLTDWQVLATATGKSTDVTYQPGGEVPAPVQLQVRVQLRRSNADYGDPSMIGQVTVNP